MVKTIIPLKKGVEIIHACKTYTHKTGIPESIHLEIYGSLSKDAKESKKLHDKKLKKHKFVEPVKDGTKGTSGENS